MTIGTSHLTFHAHFRDELSGKRLRVRRGPASGPRAGPGQGQYQDRRQDPGPRTHDPENKKHSPLCICPFSPVFFLARFTPFPTIYRTFRKPIRILYKPHRPPTEILYKTNTNLHGACIQPKKPVRRKRIYKCTFKSGDNDYTCRKVPTHPPVPLPTITTTTTTTHPPAHPPTHSPIHPPTRPPITITHHPGW